MRFQFNNKSIPQAREIILVNGVEDRYLWCDSISKTEGLGGTTAHFVAPTLLADDPIKYRYYDAKVCVYVALGGGPFSLEFVGYMQGDDGDVSSSADEMSFNANTIGHYLTQVGVGEDTSSHTYEYKLIDPRTGQPTGYTPLSVFLDIMARLPIKWQAELNYGDLTPLTGAYDAACTSFTFNLQSYKECIEIILEAFGDVGVRERFHNDTTYLDFYRTSSVISPVVSYTLGGTAGNILRIAPSTVNSEIVNRVQAFGRDKCFVVSCENNRGAHPNPDEALYNDWDPALQSLVLTDNKLAMSDRIPYSLKVKQAPPGGSVVTFQCECSINLQYALNKAILIHKKTGERMLVTAFTPATPGVPATETTPEVAAVPASVSVIRRHLQPETQAMGELKLDEVLAIEIPGISRVFREYRLPQIFHAYPRKELLGKLPILDSITQEPIDAQVLTFSSSLNPNDVPEGGTAGEQAAARNTKTGIVTGDPVLVDNCKIDLKERRISLKAPAVACVEIKKDGDKITKTFVGVPVIATFAYIDHAYSSGWDTYQQEINTLLPWSTSTHRFRQDEMQFNQVSNVGYPLVDWNGVEHVLPALILNPKTKQVYAQVHVDELGTDPPVVLRDDRPLLQVSAFRELYKRNKRHRSYTIDLDYYDQAPEIGYRVAIRGLSDWVPDNFCINQINYSFGVDGNAVTQVVCDNIKPPARRSFRVRPRPDKDAELYTGVPGKGRQRPAQGRR